jgi:peptidoglycan/xylan/chitin deacetylase (PgdA/CDA1 family)
MWLEAGLELGNHTYSHANYHEVGYEIFTKDVLKGEKVIKPISQNYNKSVKYFRHPYLKSGVSKSSSDSLKNFLNQNNYIEAPVTIDNEDYIFAAAYEKAYKANDLSLMENIGSAYINYTASKTVYYEMLAEEIFGKEIPHILLIHANKLNADYFDELYTLYKQNGYEFTTLDIVLKDESYRESVTRFGDWGISWLERWALSKRVGMDILKDAPSIPNFAHN